MALPHGDIHRNLKGYLLDAGGSGGEHNTGHDIDRAGNAPDG